jgi:membrane protein DedA with SNARE-associated domain
MLESVIDTYGYLAVFVGTFLEGETILVLGGFAARRGHMALQWVVLAAFIGSLCGDQLFFYFGRKHSQFVLTRRPSWEPRAAKGQRLVERFGTPLILVFRFLYGLRTVLPFVIGMSPVTTKRFVVLNAIGALVWAVVVGSGGYLFGDFLEVVLGNIKRYELLLYALIAATGLSVWMLYIIHRRRVYKAGHMAANKNRPVQDRN